MSKQLTMPDSKLRKLAETVRQLIDYIGLSETERREVCKYLASENRMADGNVKSNETNDAWLSSNEWPDFPDLSSEVTVLQNRKDRFARILKQRLAKADLSQADLADKLGVRQSTVSQYLSG